MFKTMEKKSKTATKEVKLKPVAQTPEEKKPTYEQLEAALQTLNQHCKELYERLQEADKIINSFNDIGMLLSILKQAEFFNDSFIARCAEKVEITVSQMLDSAEQPSESSN